MRTLFLFLLFVIYSCGKQATGFNGELEELNTQEMQERYTSMLNRIHTTTKTKEIEAIPSYLEKCLVDSVFEYWYDTPWDFNGTSEKPQQDAIACGYFVTTTLKHLGLNIDRAYLAQQAASHIINELCEKSSIKTFTNGRYKKCKEYISSYNGNIFIAGLDNHVGFIVRIKDELYFIHSRPNGVIKEKCDESEFLTNSKFHMVGHINFKNWARGLKYPGNTN